MNLYSMIATDIHGNDIQFESYRGKVLLIVNTAEDDGCVHQYEGLERIYDRYRDDGFVVLGFPSKQFIKDADDEAGEMKYDVHFPMFEAIEVSGAEIHPLFKALTESGDPVQWNFEKFLIDRDGHLRERYGADVEPREIVDDIDELI